jgi:hypothetical protein
MATPFTSKYPVMGAVSYLIRPLLRIRASLSLYLHRPEDSTPSEQAVSMTVMSLRGESMNDPGENRSYAIILETYPAAGHSWSRFFRNQEKLSEIRVENNLRNALKGADAVVLAVRHEAYLKLDPNKVVKMTGRPVAVIDCFGILDDDAIRRYFELGCEVKGLGRGHVKRIKDAVRSGLNRLMKSSQ